MISKVIPHGKSVDSTEAVVELYGLSTDSKPTDVHNATLFLEMDTKKVYIFNGASSTWIEL